MEDQLDRFEGNPDHTGTFQRGDDRAEDYTVTRRRRSLASRHRYSSTETRLNSLPALPC